MRILLAEDEEELSRVLTAALKMQGYEVDAAVDGVQAVEFSRSGNYDCMVFDIMMPRKDGITALREIRESGCVTPALFLTAKAEIDDRVTGLDAGADDYLTKPFAIRELLARIRSMTRRQNGYTPSRLSVEDVTLDTEQQELSCENAIRLSRKESRLMEYFMKNYRRECTTHELLEHIWSDEDAPDTELVFVYVSYLQQKLQSIGAKLVITGKKNESYRLIGGEEA